MFYRKICLGLVAFAVVSCGKPTPPTTQAAVLNPAYTPKADMNNAVLELKNNRTNALSEVVFQPILDSIQFKSPTTFAQLLDSTYHLGGITGHTVRRQVMYGRADSVWFVEVVYPKDTICTNYPHKKQLVFGADGRLFHQMQSESAQFLEVWDNRLPVLMTVEADCKGQGGRYLYKYENGQMVNIFNLPVGNETPILTYDNKEDTTVYYPKDLLLSIEDVDMDGDNDIVLEGQKLWLEDANGKRYPKYRPYKRLQLRYEFIYNRGKDLFVLDSNR